MMVGVSTNLRPCNSWPLHSLSHVEDANGSSSGSDCRLPPLRGAISMTASAVRLPISSSSFLIHSSSHRLGPSVVAPSSRFPPVGCMGDRGRLSAFGTERGSVSDSRGCSGYGDEGMMEQEGMLPGGAPAAPLLDADGMQSTLNGLSKWIVSVLFCSVVLLKHDAKALWTVLGFVFNVTLSVTLKRVINQERPVANLRSDPGMPSSHAQSISFIVTYAIVSLFEWIGFNQASLTMSGILLALGVYMVKDTNYRFYGVVKAFTYGTVFQETTLFVLWRNLLGESPVVMFYVVTHLKQSWNKWHKHSWLRVSQQLHTTDQVIFGGLVGTMSFLFWYVLWRAVISRAFDSFLVFRVLLVLGTSCCCIAFIVYAIRNWPNQ